MSDGDGAQPRGLVDRIFWYAGAGLMLAMTGTMMYVVTARYFFNRPPLWSEDVPRTIFVWMVFATLGLAIKRGLNIRVTTLIDVMPRRLRLSIEIAMHVLVVAMLLVLLWFTVPILRLKAAAHMLSTGWSEAVLIVPMIGGLALALLYQLRRFMMTLTALRTGRDLADEQQAGAGMG